MAACAFATALSVSRIKSFRVCSVVKGLSSVICPFSCQILFKLLRCSPPASSTGDDGARWIAAGSGHLIRIDAKGELLPLVGDQKPRRFHRGMLCLHREIAAAVHLAATIVRALDDHGAPWCNADVRRPPQDVSTSSSSNGPTFSRAPLAKVIFGRAAICGRR